MSAIQCGSEENTLQPLCTISEQKEAEEDYETNLIEKLKTSSAGSTHNYSEIVQRKPAEDSPQSSHKMRIDFEQKQNLNGKPDKIKRDYDKMKENENELTMMSKKFVEDKEAVFSVYNKRPVPP